MFIAVFEGLTKHIFAPAKMAVVVEPIVSLTRPISRVVPLIVAFTMVVLRSVTGMPLRALFAVVNAVFAVLNAVSEVAFTGSTKRVTMLFIA